MGVVLAKQTTTPEQLKNIETHYYQCLSRQ